MPSPVYYLGRGQAELTRRVYLAAAGSIARRPVTIRGAAGFDVVSYSGENTLVEQIASIRSFLRHVGEPKTFTVFSDGSYCGESIQLLQQIHPTIRVQSSTPAPSNLPGTFRSYLVTHPTGKQLAVIMSLPSDGPVLYVDSDVLFFAGASNLIELAQSQSTAAFYLADCKFSGDARLLRSALERNQPVNTGVLLILKKIDWTEAIARFDSRNEPPDFFTNQTLAHIALHAAAALPLDPAKYVLRLDDQFIYADRYASAAIALRHYVNPVRHKFWTSLIH